MLFIRTIIFRFHIAFYFLLLSCCRGTGFYEGTPNRSESLIDSTSDNNRNFSLEPCLGDFQDPPSHNSILEENTFSFNFNNSSPSQPSSNSFLNPLEYSDTSSVTPHYNYLNRHRHIGSPQYSLCSLIQPYDHHLPPILPLYQANRPTYENFPSQNTAFQFSPLSRDLLSLQGPQSCPSPLHLDLDNLNQVNMVPILNINQGNNSLHLSSTSPPVEQSDTHLNLGKKKSENKKSEKKKVKKKKTEKKSEKKKKSKSCSKQKRPNKIYPCQYCNKTFTRSDVRNYHQNRHNNPTFFECAKCGKKLSAIWSLKQHMRTHDGSDYKCIQCSKSFTTKLALEQHQRVHTGEKPFQCHICNKRFKYPSNLRTHINIHTQAKTYPCHLCNKIFNRAQNLKTHINQVHLNKRPFACICGKKFKRNDHLKGHKKVCWSK